MEKKVLILVEGQTELGFVNRVLSKYFGNTLTLVPTVNTTKVVKSGPDFKGGVTSYSKIKKELLRLLEDSSAVAVTTMFDYYGLPNDFPGFRNKSGDCFQRVAFLENAFSQDVRNNKFIPYLQLHEFESILFTEPESIDLIMTGAPVRKSKLKAARDAVASPEQINDGPSTHPSRRIYDLYTDYEKALHGQIIVENIGFDKVIEECPHIAQWIRQLRNIASAQEPDMQESTAAGTLFQI